MKGITVHHQLNHVSRYETAAHRLVASLLVAAMLIFAQGAMAQAPSTPSVDVMRLPEGAYQPRVVVDEAERLHVIFATGEAQAADVRYVRGDVRGELDFSQAMRVNSKPGTVLPIGTVRGPQLAVGPDGRAHVAWMGTLADDDEPAPMLYTRLNDSGEAFEPQRNVLQHAVGLDGGGTIAADASGRVYVAWHAGGHDERERNIWLARSDDDGETFERERAIDHARLGACACCGMAAAADGDGVWVAYRSAGQRVHRDVHLIPSTDAGQTFEQSTQADQWRIDACPMSTFSVTAAGDALLLAWETEQQVYYARFTRDGQMVTQPIAAPGNTAQSNRKHPRLAVNEAGQVLLVWTEGTGWNQGGSVAWQLFDADDEPIADGAGEADDLPVWGCAAAFARPDGSFGIIY